MAFNHVGELMQRHTEHKRCFWWGLVGSGWKGQNPIRNSLALQWAVERQRLENSGKPVVGKHQPGIICCVDITERIHNFIDITEIINHLPLRKLRVLFRPHPAGPIYASVILLSSNQETPGCSSITWSHDVNLDVNYD